MTRQKYLFDLASVCHVTPRQVNMLTVSDFAQLVVGVDRYKAELRKAGG